METVKELQKIDSIVLGDYILKHYGPMSHLKLQKLLYYCDAYHLACFDQELIEDQFEAWMHGPVCRKVYDSLKDKSLIYAELSYEYDPNEPDVDLEFGNLTKDQQTFITDILNDLSKWTGRQLEVATHSEMPWIKARAGYGPAAICHEVISKEDMKDYYRKELYGQEKATNDIQ